MPPAVVPGESIVGGIVDPDKGFESPVWHFQDDAVTGPITVVPTAMQNMPQVIQQTWTPTNYLPPWDGPSNIGQFSKDLAFELYTIIPEPSTLGLMALAAIAVTAMGRRRVY